MCRFSGVWTAGGGVDKTPCLQWGRGRERGQREREEKRQKYQREGRVREEGGKGRKGEAGERAGGRTGDWKDAVDRRWGTGLGAG